MRGSRAEQSEFTLPIIPAQTGIQKVEVEVKKPRKLGFLFVSARGSLAASFFLFLAQKKETKEKGTPLHGPSGFPALLAKPGVGLNSRFALKQRPPNSPARLCCSAWHRGMAAGNLISEGDY